MSASSVADELVFERLEYDDRYYIQTAKNSIESLAHIVGEAGSNADEAITKRAKRDEGEDKGRIEFAYDPEAMELTVTEDGIGLTRDRMKERLRRVGAAPDADARRGFFHRGIREVFLAMGGGRIVSIGQTDDGEQLVSEAVFDPSAGMAMVRSDEEPSEADREELGLNATGTRVVIPMRRFASKHPRQYSFSSVETQIRDCVQIRPVMTDPDREVTLLYGDSPPRSLRFEHPAGEGLVREKHVEINGQKATVWAKAAEKPIKTSGLSRQTRRHGILVRGERAAYEVSLGEKLRSHPGMSRVFGELRLDTIEDLQREADQGDDADEAQLVYKPDRSGLNPEHEVVQAIYEFIDEILGPLVAGLEAAGEKKDVSPDMRRQLQKLARVINDVVRDETVGDLEDSGGEPDPDAEGNSNGPEPPEPPDEHTRSVDEPIDFAYERIFISAGRSRTVKVWFDGNLIEEGAEVVVQSAPDEVIQSSKLSASEVPAAAEDGIAELDLTLKAGNEEGRHEVTITAGGFTGALPVHVRFPRASGFISQIIPKDTDWESGSALYYPSSGVVEVFVGRPEFKDAAARAKREGEEPWKHPLFRQLAVESVREAALRPAAERRAEVEWDDLPAEERKDKNAFHSRVVVIFNELDYKLRSALLKAFVEVH